jgi:3',5'-cyclic AMP phosphodiesterase CpdA
MDNLSPEASVQGAEILDSASAGAGMTTTVSLNSASPSTLEWKLPASKETFSFYAFGDNRHQYQVLEKIREDVMRERPLFLVNTGDLVMHGSEKELLDHEQFAQSFSVPYFAVLGNHDQEEGTQFAGPYQKIFGPTFYSFRYGPYAFFFLDNASGYISIRQVEWLRDGLEMNKDAVKTFVFAHQPPFDPRRGHHHAMKPFISWAPLLVTIARRGGADFFITGHLHSYYEHVSGNITYIVTGNAKGGGSEPLPFSHYVKFNVSPDGVTHELRLTGNEPLENE